MKNLIFSLIICLFCSSFVFAVAENPNNPNPLIENLKKLREIQRAKRYGRHCSEKSSTDQFEEEANVRNNIAGIAKDNPQLIEPETVEPHYFPLYDSYYSEDSEKKDCSPLAVASSIDKGEDTVRFLLRKGANPNPECQNCPLPLILASKAKFNPFSSKPKIISALLEYNADPFKKDPKYKISPFEYALKEVDSKALEVYLCHESIREKINSPSFSIDEKKVKASALRTLLEETGRGHMNYFKAVNNCICLLHKNGANIYELDSDGNTFLHSAVKYNHANINIELLHSLGININQQNHAGQTPLHTAIISYEGFVLEDDTHIKVHRLLDLGVNPNLIDNNGETALFYFFRKGEFYPLNKTLRLWHATDKSIKNNKGETVLDIIQQRYLSLVVEIAKNPNFIQHHNKSEVLDELNLLKKVLSIEYQNQKNKAGQTSLHIATSQKCFSVADSSIVHKLLEEGVNPNLIDNNGETALFYFFRESELHPINFYMIQELWQVTDKSIHNNKRETVLDIIKQRYFSLENEIAKNPNKSEALDELKALKKFLSKNNLLMAITGERTFEQNEHNS